MRLETNLQTIENASIEKYDENKSFRSYLDAQENEKVDELVRKIEQQVTPAIDCVECGSCCNNLRPLASHAELSKFLKPEDIEENMYAERFSCTHLDKDCKSCTQYLDRPSECREFPYMDRPNFAKRMPGILQNYAICPIVFNIVEELKKEMNWENA